MKQLSSQNNCDMEVKLLAKDRQMCMDGMAWHGRTVKYYQYFYNEAVTHTPRIRIRTKACKQAHLHANFQQKKLLDIVFPYVVAQ